MSAEDVVLEVRALTVRVQGLLVVEHVDLELGAGRIVGLIGPNGAGKTTLVDAVAGLVHTERGEVRLDGMDLGSLAPQRRARLGLSRTFQGVELFDAVTVGEHLDLARAVSRGHGVVAPTEVVDLLGLEHLLELVPDQLSAGQQQLVGLGRAAVAGWRVVLMDEPAAGLDAAELDRLRALLVRLRGAGVAVLLSDHDVGLVMEACDRVLVLDRGRRIAEGSPSSLRDDPALLATYSGTGAS